MQIDVENTPCLVVDDPSTLSRTANTTTIVIECDFNTRLAMLSTMMILELESEKQDLVLISIKTQVLCAPVRTTPPLGVYRD